MPVDRQTGLITYSKVKEMSGITKADLYNRALSWANTYYKNPADVIREKDEEQGKIICKARYKIMNPPDKKGFSSEAGNVQYTLNLQFKEGKYKYELTEINWKQPSYYGVEKWMDTSNAYYKQEFACYLQQVDSASKEIISSLDKIMKTNAAKNEKNDW